ncbi:DsbA family protein [Ruegeria sp. HKCCD8929]|uniref:DsbA family protein n=1 Tax=Ruegeria sp. HKCCD8929 TaxID=2683006 RepID=UPI001489345A|nr:DsbA family protein [Ruegeria sp. HKCCD8929]
MAHKFSKTFIAALIAADLARAVPAGAENFPSPSPEFIEQVRQALLQRPEIMLEVFALLEEQQSAQEAVADLEIVASVADELFEGLDPGKPILVEFQDYNCGYCRRVHANVAELKAQRPDLQVVLLETPVLGDASRHAAEVALALKATEGVEAYERFADALMTLQGNADPVSVRATLIDLGFDAEAVIQAAGEGVGSDDLKRSERLARQVGARGTPYFVGPGGIVRGFGSPEDLSAITLPPERPEPDTANGKEG